MIGPISLSPLQRIVLQEPGGGGEVVLMEGGPQTTPISSSSSAGVGAGSGEGKGEGEGREGEGGREGREQGRVGARGVESSPVSPLSLLHHHPLVGSAVVSQHDCYMQSCYNLTCRHQRSTQCRAMFLSIISSYPLLVCVCVCVCVCV